MEQRFSYSAKRVNIVVSLILGIPMIAIAVHGIATGSIISRRGNAFSPEFSLGVFVFILLTGAVLLFFGIRMIAAGRRQVIVTPTRVEMPAGISSRRIETVAVDEIRNIVIQNDQIHGRVLTLVLDGRKSLRLPKNAFENLQAFADCHDAIEGAWHASHSQQDRIQP